MAEDVECAWEIVTGAVLGPRWGVSVGRDLRRAIDVLCDNGMHDVLNDWFMETVRQRVGATVTPQFWHHFQVCC